MARDINREKHIVQDDVRERMMLRWVKLRSTGERSGPDGLDDAEHPNLYETKSTLSARGYATSRHLSLSLFPVYRQKYWLFSKMGRLMGEYVMREFYVAHPDDLECWFRPIESELREMQRIWKKVEVGIADWDNMTRYERDVFHKVCNRGTMKNAPVIPHTLVRRRATPLSIFDQDEAQAKLKEFVASRPILYVPDSEPIVNINSKSVLFP